MVAGRMKIPAPMMLPITSEVADQSPIVFCSWVAMITR
jgi:hypothetical protein